ncbi:hypothetical protein BKP57_06310 [Virgibacillus sp. 6R]|nr:hypothetical protein BKP57_06310 [Virgibacillus sp. 6R]
MKYILTQITVYIVTGVIIGIIIGVLFTLFVNMVDVGLPSFNISVITVIVLILFMVSYVVIIIVLQRISKLNLSEEINKDIT